MENNTLLGATADITQQYDNSGVFNPNTPSSDVDTSSSPLPAESETEDSSEKPVDNTSNLLMYGGAALLLYYLFFKKK